MSWLLTSDGPSTGASVSATVLPMNIQGWVPLGLTFLIFLLSKGFPRVFSSTTVWKHPFFHAQPSIWSNSHIWMTTGKTIALTIRTFVGKVMSLLFNMLSRFVIAFLPRRSMLEFHSCSHHLQWFWSPHKRKSVTTFTRFTPGNILCSEIYFVY